jgi:hypothetical protein
MTPPAASAAAPPAINPRRTVTPRRAPAAPHRPRRISGPAGRAGSIHGQTRGRVGPAQAVGLAEAVATHRLLDRLIRGRIWIGVIAFALIGIVTMQLGLLKLNAGIGRSLAREALLQRENATLSTENSEMAAGERVEAQAEHAGMELIPAGALSFLKAYPSGDASKAAAALSAWATTATTPGTTATGESGTEAGAPSTATSETARTDATSETEAATPASSASTGASSETTGESVTAPEATKPASTSAETTTAGAETETSAGASAAGASEAQSPTSASTSTGGGTTGG